MLLDDDLAVHRERRIVPDVHVVPDHQPRLVEHSPAGDRHRPKEIDVVADRNPGWPQSTSSSLDR